jgi:hypothetical protein
MLTFVEPGRYGASAGKTLRTYQPASIFWSTAYAYAAQQKSVSGV